nr:platelet binding protein GspB isoform X2 [Bactrocera oleae]XP_036233012.1 platelet binding protein GspB isoform X2 [Bactrocera oleae]XP_036233013.1 platelet binding protein GspB isoform X2 [Bactrocera oleae]
MNTTHIGNSSGGRLHLTAAAPSNSICVQTLSSGAGAHQPLSQSTQMMGLNKSFHLQQQPLQQHHHQLTAANVACQAMQQNMTSSVGSTSSSNECSYKNCHLNISASTALASSSAVGGSQQRRSQRALPVQATHVTHDMLQQFVTVADVEISGNTVGYHSLPNGTGVGGGDSEIEQLRAATVPTSTQYTGSQMTGAISTPSMDVLPLMSGEIATISNNTSDSITQTAISAVSGPHTLPTNAHTQTLKSGNSTNSISSQSSKTPSSSRRYHRTIPRYFALTDPLSDKEAYGISKSKSENSSRASASSTVSSVTSTKKPTCQCPVQHVPMSYMATTQLSNVAQCASNSALLSSLSSKLNAACQLSAASQTSSASSTLVTSHGSSSNGRSNTVTTLGNPQRAKSSNSLQQSSTNDANCFGVGNTLKRTIHTTSTSTNTATLTNNNNSNTNATSVCSYDMKIATISKQVGDSSAVDLGTAISGHHHHAAHHSHHSHHAHSVVVLPSQTHDESMPIVLGRVHKRSSGERERERERARSASSGRASSNSSTHQMENSAAAIYLNGKGDAYLNFPHPQNFSNLNSQQQQQNHHQQQQTNETNPILPPKLHKSLTNLKTTTNNNHSIMTTATVISCAAVTTPNPTTTATTSSSCPTVQTVYTLSKPSTSTTAHTNRKEYHSFHEPINGNGGISSCSKNSPLSLTLPLSEGLVNNFGSVSTSTGSASGSSIGNNTVGSQTHSAEKSSKINSSTFYPLQNNHVTYTLPKYISGKVSLNSTIASVVSKVPSVISIPVGGGEVDLFENNNSCVYALNHSNSTNGKHESTAMSTSKSSSANGRSTTLPKILRAKKQQDISASNNCNSNIAGSNIKYLTNTTSGMTTATASISSVAQCNMPVYPQQSTSSHVKSTATANATTQFNSIITDSDALSSAKHLPVCTTSKNCQNPKEHFLPNDTSLDDDYLSECENCKIAQSAKYYLNAEEVEAIPQETMTLQRKSMDDNKEEQEQSYYRISHTLPTNPKKNAPVKNNNREPWFSTIPASSSSEEDVNE